MPIISKGFASDNNSGVLPEVLKAIQEVNLGHAPAYGTDSYTEEAQEIFKKHFGAQAQVFFVFNGTAANILSVMACSRSWHSILAAHTSHMHDSECGAPEFISGSKLIPLPSTDGKISVESISQELKRLGDPHHSQPRVVSITQPTEYGTVYRASEIKVIAEFAHKNGMILHMDGARLPNAVAFLNCSFKDITTDCGVDIVSFGGAKSGLLMGDAVVILKPEFTKNFQFLQKQTLQLGAKMRFLSAQFKALLENEVWKRNALHVNKMAKLLAELLSATNGVEITQPVETNAVFAKIPRGKFELLREKFYFYMWDEKLDEVRWMTNFDTTEEEIRQLAEHIRATLQS